MPAGNVSIEATFEASAPTYKEVLALDFEENGNGDASVIENKGFADGFSATVEDGTGDNTTKVLKLTASDSTQSNQNSGYSNAVIDFSNLVDGATKIKVEFDSYNTLGRTSLSLIDKNFREYAHTGAQGGNGIFFSEGSNNGNFHVNGTTNSTTLSPFGNKWVHTVVEVDYATRTTNFTLTAAEVNEYAKESQSYQTEDPIYVTGLEARTWQNSNITYIDNVKVSIMEGDKDNKKEVKVHYIDKETSTDVVGKAARTRTDAAIVGSKINALSTDKVTFDNDAENPTYRYVYNAESTDTVVVGESGNDINLNFDRYEYKETTIKVVPPAGVARTEAMTVPVIISGTPDSATKGDAVTNRTVNVTIASDAEYGTATTRLLDGTYTYTIAETATGAAPYLGKTDVSLATIGGTNEIQLEENSNVPTKVTINFLDSNTENTEPLKTQVVLENQIYVGDSFTLDGSYLVPIPVKGTTTPFSVYKYNSSASDAITIASLAATNNVINLKFTNDGTKYLYFENFEGSTNPFTAWHNSARAVNMSLAKDAAKKNAKAGQILTMSANAADGMASSGEIDLGSNNDTKVELDFRLDPDAGNRNVGFTVAGAAMQNNTFWLNDTTKPDTAVFNLIAHTKNGSNGEFDSVSINGKAVDAETYAKFVIADPDQAGLVAEKQTATNTTGWLHLNAVIHQSAKTVDITITRIATGETVYSVTGQAFKTEAAATGKLYVYGYTRDITGGFSFDDLGVSIVE